MRLALAVAVLALSAFVAATPAASARELPVFVRPVAELTPPTAECPTCLDAAVGAGVGMSGCCDLPAFGALVEVSGDGDGVDGRARVCYTSFVYQCYVDLPVHV